MFQLMSLAPKNIRTGMVEESAVTERRIVAFSGADLDRVRDILASDFLPALERQPGYLSASMFQNRDGAELTLVTVWRNLRHQKVWASSREIKTAGAALDKLLESDHAKMQVRTYLAFRSDSVMRWPRTRIHQGRYSND